MSEQTYCFVLSPPWLFLTYHLQHNARCQTQTVMPIPPTAKRLCHLQPKSASGSFFFCEVWSKRKQSVNLWWNIFAWAENVKCESGFGLYFSLADSNWKGCWSPSSSPPTLFMVDRAWPVCGPRHDRVKTWKVCIWRKRKKSIRCCLACAKKSMPAQVGVQKKLTHKRTHTLSHKVDGCESLVHRDESIKQFLSTLRE